MSILTQLPSDKLSTAEHIAPLIVAAELQVTVVLLEHVIKVIGLHDHVVKLQERKTLLHTLLVALGSKHIVNRETGTNLSEQLNVIQVHKPVGIIDHHSFSVRKINKTLHLLLKAFCIMINVFSGKHLSHIASAGRVTDHGSAAADQSYRLITCLLKPLHKCKCHKMTCCKAVCGTVKADIKCCFSVVDQISYLCLIGSLSDKTTLNQFFIDSHSVSPFVKQILVDLGAKIKPSAPVMEQRAKNPRYHLYLSASHKTLLIMCHHTLCAISGAPVYPYLGSPLSGSGSGTYS